MNGASIGKDTFAKIAHTHEGKRAAHWVACHMVDAVGKNTPLVA